MKAYCRRCEDITSHRFHENEVVCDLCDWIAISFHEPVVVKPYGQPELEVNDLAIVIDSDFSNYPHNTQNFLRRHAGKQVTVTDAELMEVEVCGISEDGCQQAVWVDRRDVKPLEQGGE